MTHKEMLVKAHEKIMFQEETIQCYEELMSKQKQRNEELKEINARLEALLNNLHQQVALGGSYVVDGISKLLNDVKKKDTFLKDNGMRWE